MSDDILDLIGLRQLPNGSLWIEPRDPADPGSRAAAEQIRSLVTQAAVGTTQGSPTRGTGHPA